MLRLQGPGAIHLQSFTFKPARRRPAAILALQHIARAPAFARLHHLVDDFQLRSLARPGLVPSALFAACALQLTSVRLYGGDLDGLLVPLATVVSKVKVPPSTTIFNHPTTTPYPVHADILPVHGLIFIYHRTTKV